MAIRFRCSACAQPIEIDDQWASKAVACPYCRKTVTAPAESMFEDLSQVPMAIPVAGDPLPSAEAPLDAALSQPPTRNTLALVAVILSVVAVGMLIGASWILSGHSAELEEFQKIANDTPNIKEQADALSKFLEDHPGAERWFFPAIIMPFAGCLASLASIVCAVIGLRRPRGRGMAVVALVIAGLVPLVMCGGGAIFR